MFSCRKLAVGLCLLTGLAAHAQQGPYAGIGRAATPKEVAAWDIDVRPDFKGLPKGSGSVSSGQDIWEAKCASCHGVFGESNQFFSPLIGGTTKQDVQTGRVARLNDAAYPGRTTMMKAAHVSTLWDYIYRAMPWNQPKSLTPDEVYGVTAFMLNLAGIVPDNFTLSDGNIADVQKLLPNRNGMTTDHALWPGKGLATAKTRPDVMAVACMKNCATEPTVASILPDFARNAHGNLAEQNRLVGAQRGADTGKLADVPGHPAPAPATTAATPAAPASKAAPAASAGNAAAIALAGKYSCTACHAMQNKGVGPAFLDIAKKYSGRTDAVQYLAGKIKSGGSGVWGSIPMPPQTLGEEDAKAIAQWLAAGAQK